MTPEQVDRYLLAREAMQSVYHLLDLVRVQEREAAEPTTTAPLGVYTGTHGAIAIEPDPTYPRATRVRVIERTEA